MPKIVIKWTALVKYVINFVKPQSKNKKLKAKTQKEFDKCKHMELTIENPDINNVDEVFYAYSFQQKRNMSNTLINVYLR